MALARSIYFANLTPMLASGSSYLRSDQLMQVSRPVLEAAGFHCSLINELIPVRDALIILNKNSLTAMSPETIAAAQSAGNRLLGDPLDGLIAYETLAACDGLIAASLCQNDALRQAFPGKPVHYVAHHVDTRLPAMAPPRDRLRMGYFGEMLNAAHAQATELDVTFVPVNTAQANIVDWMGQLAFFNAHYALRADRPIDGPKPFTKGFVAAWCNAPVLIDGNDLEARRHLPHDYPFVTDRTDLAAVRDALRRMRDGFAGPEWRRAMAAMEELKAHADPNRIARQVLQAVRA